MLMDEPFSGLDEQNGTLLQGNLLRIRDETPRPSSASRIASERPWLTATQSWP